ncbi:MAG: hypothetical protein LBH09_00300 [Peptococcaceae bacterium]|jgi:uncharacterized GH25 family protein|nr:hypothetical protein [Peptococcaceae bacterium]
MEFVRQVVDSKVLDKINLPHSLQNRKVEIIILPADIEEPESSDEKDVDNIVGILAAYKNPDFIPTEKGAWMEAVEGKHGSDR